METATTSSSGKKSDGRKWAGWVWFAFMMALVLYWHWVIAPEFRPRNALDLGERFFDYFPELLGISGLGFITCLVWDGLGLFRLIERSPDWWLPWAQLAAFVALSCALIVKENGSPPPNPINPDSEALYLEFARVVREEFAAKDLGYLSLDQKGRTETSSAALAAQQRLLPLIPDYWPRPLLEVYLDKDRVRLSRGSGMLGDLGVMIYDQGPVVLHTPEELKRNGYLPNQKRITDRLWFFTSG